MPDFVRDATAEPVEHRVDVGDLALAYVEWPGEGRTVVLAHATGFHARTWDAVARLLPEHRVIALDMRGHGRSDKPPSIDSWEVYADDTLAFMRALGLHGAIGVGHSMGGHSLATAAARAPETFAGLVLVDPVMPLDGQPPQEGRGGASDFVRRRRNVWSSPDEMVERFRDRFPYSGWRPEVLEAYARWGLLPNPDGEGYVLACSPDFEADTYAAAGSGPAMAREVIPYVRVPVRVLRGRQPVPGEEAPAFSTSPTPPQLASLFAEGEDAQRSDLSHFIPMEAPEFVAEQVRILEARLRILAGGDEGA